ncbi:hypothetical protein Dimus_038808 [Dionaea muscipula]
MCTIYILQILGIKLRFSIIFCLSLHDIRAKGKTQNHNSKNTTSPSPMIAVYHHCWRPPTGLPIHRRPRLAHAQASSATQTPQHAVNHKYHKNPFLIFQIYSKPLHQSNHKMIGNVESPSLAMAISSAYALHATTCGHSSCP